MPKCINVSVLQCFNKSTLQRFNASTIQCFKRFNASMLQHFKVSMLQCFIVSTQCGWFSCSLLYCFSPSRFLRFSTHYYVKLQYFSAWISDSLWQSWCPPMLILTEESLREQFLLLIVVFHHHLGKTVQIIMLNLHH